MTDLGSFMDARTKMIIANDTLVAITVLTAESKPEEMDVVIKLIMNFLVG